MNSIKTSGEKKLLADIVVIGGGGAGLMAAVAAAEAGVQNIVVIESRNAPGGNSLFPFGLLGAETPLQRRLGVDAPKDMVYKKAMEYAHWKLNGRLIRSLIDISGDTIQWLEEKGVVFTQLNPHYLNPVPNTFHSVSNEGREKTGAVIVKTLVKTCRELGIQILLHTRARKILTDGQGNLTGIVASVKDGDLKIETGCVITATGGFAGNEEFIKKYHPSYNQDEVDHGGMAQNGDGTLMALEIGACMDDQLILEMFAPQFKDSVRLTHVAKRPNTVWINKNGERFADENTGSDMEAANILYRQPGRLCYSLFDEEIFHNIMQEALCPLELMMIDEKSFKEGMEADLKTQLENGKIKIANSMDEIAVWMGVEPEVLGSTIDEYNKSCDHGYDDLFLKERRFLFPLRNPPYYAIPGKITLIVTHGGINTNHRLEALNKEGNPIPGLYAAGIEIGGTEANTYNIYLSGHSFGFALFSGRIAGMEAAKYVLPH